MNENEDNIVDDVFSAISLLIVLSVFFVTVFHLLVRAIWFVMKVLTCVLKTLIDAMDWLFAQLWISYDSSRRKNRIQRHPLGESLQIQMDEIADFFKFNSKRWTMSLAKKQYKKTLAKYNPRNFKIYGEDFVALAEGRIELAHEYFSNLKEIEYELKVGKKTSSVELIESEPTKMLA